MLTRFIGLDLAWSPRNNTAAVALEADGRHAHWIAHCEHLGNDEEVVDFAESRRGWPSRMVRWMTFA